MTKKIVSLILLILLLTQVSLAQTQTTSAANDWAAVKVLSVGEEVKVVLKSGKKHKGKFAAASDSQLTINHKNKPETFNQNEIAAISRFIGKGEKAKYTGLMGAAGAGAGAAIGGVKAGSTGDDGGIYVVAGLIIGAGIGALAGLGIGGGRKKEVPVYQAK